MQKYRKYNPTQTLRELNIIESWIIRDSQFIQETKTVNLVDIFTTPLKISKVLVQWKSVCYFNKCVRSMKLSAWLKCHCIKKQVLIQWKAFIAKKLAFVRRMCRHWYQYTLQQKKLRHKLVKKQHYINSKKLQQVKRKNIATLTKRLQTIRSKYVIKRYIQQWKMFTAQKIRKKIICQVVKTQWLQAIVYPARLINIQLDRIFIQFLAKSLAFCIPVFHVLLKQNSFTKAGEVFLALLPDLAEPTPTRKILENVCRKVTKSSFPNQLMNLLESNTKLSKFYSVTQIVTDLVKTVSRLLNGLTQLENYIETKELNDVLTDVLSKRYNISLFQVLRWQRNNHTPKFITLVSNDTLTQITLKWLTESEKRVKTVDIYKMLNDLLPDILEVSKKDIKVMFNGNLDAFRAFFQRKDTIGGIKRIKKN